CPFRVEIHSRELDGTEVYGPRTTKPRSDGRSFAVDVISPGPGPTAAPRRQCRRRSRPSLAERQVRLDHEAGVPAGHGMFGPLITTVGELGKQQQCVRGVTCSSPGAPAARRTVVQFGRVRTLTGALEASCSLDRAGLAFAGAGTIASGRFGDAAM